MAGPMLGYARLDCSSAPALRCDFGFGPTGLQLGSAALRMWLWLWLRLRVAVAVAVAVAAAAAARLGLGSAAARLCCGSARFCPVVAAAAAVLPSS